MKIGSNSEKPPQLLTKLALMNKEKKNQKKKGAEPRITLAELSPVSSPLINCSFYLLFLLSGVLS